MGNVRHQGLCLLFLPDKALFCALFPKPQLPQLLLQPLSVLLRPSLGPEGQQRQQGRDRHPRRKKASGKEKIPADRPVGPAVQGVIAVLFHDLRSQAGGIARGIPAHDPGIAVLILRVLPHKSPQLLLILRLHGLPGCMEESSQRQQYKKEQPRRQGYSLKLSSVHI